MGLVDGFMKNRVSPRNDLLGDAADKPAEAGANSAPDKNFIAPGNDKGVCNRGGSSAGGNRWRRLSVPVMNDMFTLYPDSYLRMLKEAGAETVFLSLRRSFSADNLAADLAALTGNIRTLEAAGFAAGVWIQAFGFGNPLPQGEEKLAPFRRIMDFRGNVCGDAFCPTDGNYVAFLRDIIRKTAAAGAKLLMLDDDLCLNIRPGLGCACDAHIKMYERAIGRPVDRSELKKLIYGGKAAKERRLWLKLMGDTLRDFCRKMRETADEINPAMRMGFCAGYTSWDMEGADALELTRILAGNTRPFLRLSGAPYWDIMRRFPGQNPAHIVEFTRMQVKWCEEQDVDFFTENDSYPRPRYRVPASLCEGFDFCMTASGTDRQLKYLFDYFSRPEYETGYLDAHKRNLDRIRRAGAMGAGLTDAGVYVHEDMHRLAEMNLLEDASDNMIMSASAFSFAATLLSGLGIPTTYRPQGGVAAAFGAAGRTVPLTGFKGYILDREAALELAGRGVDTGIADSRLMDAPIAEYFPEADDLVSVDWLDTSADTRFYKAQLRDKAEVQSVFKCVFGDTPASYVYTNAEGMRFLVLLWRGDTLVYGGALSRSYFRQEQIVSFCERAGAPVPAYIPKCPGNYVLCRHSGDTMALSVCNFSQDEIADAEVKLSENWNTAEGEIRQDGSRWRIGYIPAHGFTSILLKK